MEIILPKKINVAESLSWLEKDRCEEDLTYFIRKAWHIVEPGAAYVDGWHIKLICMHLQAITDGEEIDDKPYNRLLINVPPGMMKAADENEPVLTPFGWKRHGDLEAGDFVFGPDGKTKRVIASTTIVEEESCRVTFDDGASTIVGVAHEWAVERWRYGDTGRIYEQKVVETRSLRHGARPDRIPLPAAVKTSEKRLLIDPYLLGAWLGDGSSSAGCIYAAEQDVNHFSELGEITHTSLGGKRGQPFHRIRVDDLQVKLRMLGLLNNKHVPADYLEANGEQRLAILQGLMDTDGNALKNGECVFWNKNKQLADSVAFLVASLGMKAFRGERYTILNGKKHGPHYRVLFRAAPGIKPFRLERKAERVARLTDKAWEMRGRSRYVKKVEPVGIRRVNCIQVEGGIYLLGRDLIPTHNSLLVNVFWPAWEWGPKNRANLRYLLISHKIDLPILNAGKLRRLLSSDWYQKRWPLQFQSDQNAKTRFENNKTGFVAAVAAGSVTGQRGDRVILDDAMSWEGANSEQTRATTIEWFLGALPTRLNSPVKSAIVVIEQRLHEEDISGVILDRQLGYDHVRLPMRYEADDPMPATWLGVTDPRTIDGELLFPERFPLHTVEREERTMSKYEVSGQFQQQPVPKGGGVIDRMWWRVWDNKEFPELDYILASLDTAYGEKQENDYSAMTIWGVFTVSNQAMVSRRLGRDGRPETIERIYAEGAPNCVLMYAWRERLAFHELIKKVLKTCRDFKIDRIIIEDKAAGISVIQELRRVVGAEEFGIQAVTPRGDKWQRLNSVSHLWHEGIFWAPEKDWAEMTMIEVQQFPKGKHDDLTDTCSHAAKFLRDSGLLSRAPERLQEIEDSKQYVSRSNLQPLYPV